MVSGSILDAEEKYICHQCNCVSNTASGLAADIFKSFPWSDSYSGRTQRSIPGEIEIHGDGINERYVISLFGQYYPGKLNNYPNDNESKRRDYFYSGLKKIIQIENLESIAFPWSIGCGLAGGNWWEYYEPILNAFAKSLEKKDAVLSIYRI